MLGHFGLPGSGIIYGYGVFNSSFKERKRLTFAVGNLPQGVNPVSDFIPVARLTDMLERPGEGFDYNGRRLTYPDIGLIYWAGGNPFHHHQDLNRLDRAWSKPETIIVNEMYWTATARRAAPILCSRSLRRLNAMTSQHQVLMPGSHQCGAL